MITVCYAVAVEPRSTKPAVAQGKDVRLAQSHGEPGSRGEPEGGADSDSRDFRNIHARGAEAVARDLKFTHITTNDGLSQGYVVAILQDRRGFMWFATRDGLNRYDGNAFVVYKNNPNDPDSLSSNFIQDLMEDDHGYLWIATNTGVDKFDPLTERCTRYLHDPKKPDSLGGASVKSIAQDSRGTLWLGTEDSGLDRLDPATQTFTHYRTDSDGKFLGRISQVIAEQRSGYLGCRRAWSVPSRRNGRTVYSPCCNHECPQCRQRV